MENYVTDLEAWVWRYLENTRNYPGLHFTARENACSALLKCLDALLTDGVGSHRTIPLRRLDPADEAKVTGGHRFGDFDRLVLRFSDATAGLHQLSVSYSDRRATVEFTTVAEPLLRSGIEDVQRGSGDWALAPSREAPMGAKDRESLQLWFWPCFGHTRPVP